MSASLPLKERLCYYLSKPVVRREPVLRPSLGNPGAPDNAATHFYGTVLQDQGKFRMWYYACHQGDKPGLDPLTENVVVPGMAAGRVRPRAPRPKLSCSAPGMSGSSSRAVLNSDLPQPSRLQLWSRNCPIHAGPIQ